MPYKRNYRRRNYKKKRYVRRVPANRQPTTWQAVSKLASDIWYLKGLVNSELYKFDTAISTTVVNTGSVQNLCQIATGDTEVTRTGNSIFVRSVYVILNTSMSQSANNTLFRIALVQDKQQIGDTAPAITDVYEGATPQSALYKATVGRFKILWTRTVPFSITGNQTAMIKKFFKCRIHVRYNANTTADLQKNGLYLMMSSDEATNGVAVAGTARLSYHDN